ncbi:hypothetical protein Goklo_004706, partial [Gossypium klotzschianum]|nr:hypothetical protein [Gossypium klotzschianum]
MDCESIMCGFNFRAHCRITPKGYKSFSTNGIPPFTPWGWFIGFITTPTTRCLSSQHLDPAVSKLFWFTPTFPTCPTIAEQFLDIKRPQ